jgi:hypothetical protein
MFEVYILYSYSVCCTSALAVLADMLCLETFSQ